MAEIIEQAGVSSSSFQNIFRAKDGVLTELVQFMFENQFAMARSAASVKWCASRQVDSQNNKATGVARSMRAAFFMLHVQTLLHILLVS